MEKPAGKCRSAFFQLYTAGKRVRIIGINKIDTMLKQPNCPFVLFVVTRKLVKRREFEEFIRREVII